MRKRLSYANVASTLALVLAVGTGGAWAATTINGKLLKKNTVTGNKLKKNTLTAREVNESKLTKVPSAAAADAAAVASVAELANNATNATTATSAGNAGTLGGLAPGAFVQGGGTQSTGHLTAASGANPNVVKTFQTPVGEFRLGCGAASVDVRYFNTTPGDAHVFRSIVGTTTETLYNVEASGGAGLGFAAAAGNGPHFVDIRAAKNDQTAIIRVGERREPSGQCIWNWELVSP